MEDTQSFQLKKPVLVWIIGCCFILAPAANMATALWVGSVSEWYLPSGWLRFFVAQDLLQQVILAMVPVAGISLLIQRKTSWLFAVILLFGACAQNVAAYFSHAQLPLGVAGPLLVNGAVLVVFYYFRCTHTWINAIKSCRGISNRYHVTVPVPLDRVDGVTTQNLSNTGCYLKFPKGQIRCRRSRFANPY